MTEGGNPGSRPRAMIGLLVVALATAGVLAYIDPKVGGGDTDGRGPAGSRPNVVLIVTDDQPANTLETMERTGRLLAEKGATFTEAYALDPCCATSASLLTGRLLHNRRDQRGTLGDWLAEDGYEVALVGSEPGSTDPTARALAELGELLPMRDPFFLQLSYAVPASEPGSCEVPDLITPDPPRTPDLNEPDVSDKPREIKRRKRLGEEALATIEQERLCRTASLNVVDRAVAKLVKALREAGELNNTMVVLTSDAGRIEGQHRIPGSTELPYMPAWRVPLVVRGADAEPGSIVEARVTSADIAATVLALAGAKDEPTDPLDGRSWLPALTGKRLPERPLLFEGELYESVLRPDDLLYTRWASGEEELYDLADDPFQLRSLDRDPRFTDEQAELELELERLLECAGTEHERADERPPCG